MYMTITEKILAAHCDRGQVRPGELIEAEIDVIMCNDVTTPPAISMLVERGMDRVFDPDRIVVTPDHFVPNKDIKSAQLAKRLRNWVNRHGIRNYYEVGTHGICHAILPEQGHVLPGTTVICGDSHTCTHGALGAFATGVGSTDLAAAIYSGRLWFKVPESIKFVINGNLQEGVYSKDIILQIIDRIGVDGALYKAMEFTGPTIENLSVEARMTITNMAVEAGAKSGIVPADDRTIEYVRARTDRDFQIFHSDQDAEYAQIVEIDVSDLEPIVAFPHLPSNGHPISEIEEIKIDQAYLGSCTNGRIEDLRVAARILKGRRVAPGVRMIVVPATTRVWRQALQEGLLEVFSEAGCAISTPTCGACLGGYMGILAEGERCISSTNRNFVGRMGHPESEVYLASPATVAASAIKGTITDPREFL
ncbi:MAG TPA: 3-isopropylmalate dehydratase large subunit [Candidatus Latescibacteria bacterium]|nr:3-isopropylmalate dehydratase large subunit [Candidatus Latescibacterota bacterium]